LRAFGSDAAEGKSAIVAREVDADRIEVGPGPRVVSRTEAVLELFCTQPTGQEVLAQLLYGLITVGVRDELVW
jgi:hypothetical protein